MGYFGQTLGAFVVAFLLCVIFGGWIIEQLRKLKARQTISEDAPERHQTKQGTPTMGGLMILGATTVAAMAFGGLQALPLVLITLAFGAIGFIDDFLIAKRGKNLGLKARQKLALQFLVAIGAALWYKFQVNRVVMDAYGIGGIQQVSLGIWFYPLLVLVLVWMSNATNLADGLDGLSAGTMVASMAPLALIAAIDFGSGPYGSFAGAVVGACLGFLWFNGYPAKVFMGDTGSLALGPALVMMAVLTHMELPLLLFGGIFIAEGLSVMMQVVYFKLTHGKRIFRMSPLHHHFELSGWEETRVVVRFWAVQIVLSAIGLWLLWGTTR